jgi:PAS domain-containing protein
MSALLVLAGMGNLAVCVLDADGSVARVNERFCRLVASEPIMLEDRRWDEVRAAPALQSIDIDSGGTQRKDCRTVWSGPSGAGQDESSPQPEWIVWRRKAGNVPGRTVIAVQVSDDITLRDPLPRRRRKGTLATPPQDGSTKPAELQETDPAPSVPPFKDSSPT